MASGSHECQFPSCDSTTHGNGLSRFIQLGVAFDLKRRRRHAALTSHGTSSTARRARANAEPVLAAPAAAMADLHPAADNQRICSGEFLVSELHAVPVPGSGRTHLAVRLTVGGPRLLTRFWPEIGKLRSRVCPEIRMSTWK
jgi:hypothetical protein